MNRLKLGKTYRLLARLALGACLVLPHGIGAQAAGQDVQPPGYYSGDPLPAHTVYLTFDDGPGEYTAALLDILRQKQVRATFFINSFDRLVPREKIGSANYLLHYRTVLQRMLSDGHVIGNHSFSHRDFAVLDASQIAFELDTLQTHLNEALGPNSPQLRLIRPPWGSPWFGTWGSRAQKIKVAKVVEPRGIVMNWTNAWNSGDSNEWVAGEWWRSADRRYRPAGTAWLAKEERMLKHILASADGKASGILLLHDIHPTSRDLLPRLIDALRERGYSFATLDEYCSWRWGPDWGVKFMHRP